MRRYALLQLVMLGLLGITTSGHAQRGPGAAPDEVDLALAWSQGRYRAPIICTFDGHPRSGLRRVEITQGSARSAQRMNQLTFFDLEARDAERCATTLGGDSPNIVGRLWLGYTPKRPRSDTPDREFTQLLRDGTVAFEIVRGRLRTGPAPLGPDALDEIDLAGGTVRLELVRSGSDAARVLAHFGPVRKMELVIEGPDGTVLRMPLAALPPTPPRPR